MVDHKNVLNFIRKTGYLTEKNIRESYKEEEQELLNIALTYLIETNKIRKISFQSPLGEENLFYIL